MKRPPFARTSIALAAIAVAGLGAVSLSGHTPRNESPAVQSAEAMAPGSGALRAYLDPETGGVTIGARTADNEELDANTQNALRRDTEGLVEVHHPDGSVSMDLQGRFQSVSMVHKDANGTVVTCVDDDGKAQQVIDGKVAPPNAPGVK